MEKSCTNCVFEYCCKWNKEMYCDDWHPDLDTKESGYN